MATGFEVATNEHLIRTNIWTKQLKTLLLDDLYAMRFVKPITDFPDGTTFNIPSVGEAETADFLEGMAVKYNKMDTGNFTFTWDQYIYSANSVSEKFKRDSFYADEVIAMFLPREHRAIMERVEARIFNRMNAGQTASNLNTINGGDHRWVGSGLNETIGVKDFARARYSLTKANVPMTNLTAVVDPSVTYALQTQANLVNLLTPQPQWQTVVRDGLNTGFRFRFNIMGFDVYESNYLPGSIAETIGGLSTTVGVANFFFSAAPGDTLPVIGGFKQTPTVYSEFNKDQQQWEYLTISEFGFKLYRPENLITVLTDIDQVI
jgi:hypothetical protein